MMNELKNTRFMPPPRMPLSRPVLRRRLNVLKPPDAHVALLKSQGGTKIEIINMLRNMLKDNLYVDEVRQLLRSYLFQI